MAQTGFSTPASMHSYIDVDPTNKERPGFGTGMSTVGNSQRTSSEYQQRPRARYFRSRRVPKGEYEKPWLDDKKDPREKWTRIIPLIGVLLGLIVIGGLVYIGMSKVSPVTLCPVLDEDFSSGSLDPKIWTQEVEVDGFGNGQFEETTNTGENAYIQDGQLIIKPTLQDAKLVEANSVIDLRGKGCTGTTWEACVAVTNVTNGTIVNPVKSARLNTKVGAQIKYGRVEVVAKMPAGDWMWPAIWMLPANDTYGVWPASGEIDIAESRGNNHSYPDGGNQIMSSTLHLGPDTDEDSYYRYIAAKTALHSTFADKFHTFGLEWTDKYLFTYLDTRPQQVIYVRFFESFWKRNQYPAANSNGTQLVDIWSQTGNDATPFDENFYLILNVAVGKCLAPKIYPLNMSLHVLTSVVHRKHQWLVP